MGVLKVKVGGEWIPVRGGGGDATSVAPEEVVVGASDPGEGVELWYDTDDAVAPFASTWGETGVLSAPVAGALVDSTWGQWVDDSVDTNTIPNYVGHNQLGSPVTGMLTIDAGSISLLTGASGELSQLPFKVTFIEMPLVVVCSGDNATGVTVALSAVTYTNFTVVFRNVNGGAPVPNAPVRVNYIAVGRRA